MYFLADILIRQSVFQYTTKRFFPQQKGVGQVIFIVQNHEI